MELFYFQVTTGRQVCLCGLQFALQRRKRLRCVQQSLKISDLQLHSISSFTSHGVEEVFVEEHIGKDTGTNLQPIILRRPPNAFRKRKMQLRWVMSSRRWVWLFWCVSSASCYFSSSADSTGHNKPMETHWHHTLTLWDHTHTHTHRTSCT